MSTNNLAERLLAFEATLRSMDQRVPDETRATPPANELLEARWQPVRRSRRARIQIRDQGLRPFRVF
jgi:hypothetical protein